MFALNGALFGIWASRIPAVAERHALSPGELGLLLLLLAGGAICAFPLAGRAADRFGAYRVTVRIAVFYAVSLLPVALAPGPVALGAGLFVFGALHGGMDVTMNAWAGEAERRAGRPMMSSFHAMFSLGAGLGAGSGYLASEASMSVPVHFAASAGLFALAAFPFARITWQPEPASAGPRPPLLALPRGALLAVGVVAFCSALGEGAMADWSAVFLIEVARTDEASAALGYAVFSAAMVTMRLLGDRAIRALGPVAAARLAGTVAVAGVLVAVAGASLPAALIGFALMGLGYAVIMPLAFTRAANDPTLSPGAAIAGVSTLAYGGMLLGPPIIGFVAEEATLRGAFLLLAALSLTVVVLASALRTTARVERLDA